MIKPTGKQIVIGTVAVVISILLLAVAWPLIGSYLLGKPLHFIELDRYSTRDDIYRWLGEPDEQEEYLYPNGSYYDVYKTKILGVPGEISVDYFEGTDDVFVVQFTVNSVDFKSQAAYERATARTRLYFESVLSRWQKNDHSDDEDFSISWVNRDRHIAYTIYDSKIYDKNFNESDGMIFQFNTWTEEMDQKEEELVKDIRDLYESLMQSQKDQAHKE